MKGEVLEARQRSSKAAQLALVAAPGAEVVDQVKISRSKRLRK
jgi:hypothetical protein